MKFILVFFFSVIFFLLSCQPKETKIEYQETANVIAEKENHTIKLDQAQANRLASLPLKCMQNEYPNKTGQVLSDSTDLGTPKDLHPAFYGCFDWHSSVHGHWSLVKLLKDFPDLENRDSIILKLKQNISKENIQAELAYFNRKQEYSYERMYGWTWLLKLQLELDTWNTDDGKEMAKNLQPLTDLIVLRYIEFLPKLNYPIRVGTHTNSAFGMAFAYDYAVYSNQDNLKNTIVENAKRLYFTDENCPISWEPDGTDFLSPCLEEVDLMERVLEREDFLVWTRKFLPQLNQNDFHLEVAKISDRKDGHLVHLDGLNFSRAWVFYRLAKKYPAQFKHLYYEADKHMEASLSVITDGSYEGEHWLASFALYALSER